MIILTEENVDSSAWTVCGKETKDLTKRELATLCSALTIALAKMNAIDDEELEEKS